MYLAYFMDLATFDIGLGCYLDCHSMKQKKRTSEEVRDGAINVSAFNSRFI